MQFAKALMVLVALENGGVIEVDARSGSIAHTYQTGPNAFGIAYDTRTARAYVTDKTAGTLSCLDTAAHRILWSIPVGVEPHQPAFSADGRVFVAVTGEGHVAIVDVSQTPPSIRKVSTGAGSRPHIVSLSPNGRTLFATVQGTDPKVVALNVSRRGDERVISEMRYDLVPRVLDATDRGAFVTAHHSTGLHYADLDKKTISTPYMDRNGEFSTAKNQIEGAAVSTDGSRVAFTHEGRRALVVLRGAERLEPSCELGPLAANPYWVSLDAAGRTAYVSIPDSGLVEAYDVERCAKKPIWSAKVGGKPKRLAVATSD